MEFQCNCNDREKVNSPSNFYYVRGHSKGDKLEAGIPLGVGNSSGGVNSGGGAEFLQNSTADIFSVCRQITAVNSAHIHFPRLLSIKRTIASSRT